MKYHDPYYQNLTINEQVFLQNVQTLKAFYQKPLGVVVKGHAYGHDLLTGSKLFVKAGISRLICYHLSDAVTLRKKYNNISILLIGPVSKDEIAVCSQYTIELTIWNLSFWKQIQEKVKEKESGRYKLSLHFEIETGMYRTGIEPDEMKLHLRDIVRQKEIQLVGFCTHLSGADEPENIDRVRGQINVFRNFKSDLQKSQLANKKDLEWHGPNSAGLLLDDADVFTNARTGILAYGFFPSVYSKSLWPSDKFPLPEPAIEWKSRIAGFQTIPGNRYTGYGKTHQTQQERHTVMIPTGYGDGFPRSLSNQWKIKIGQAYYPIIGRVNMNQIIVDVTDLPNDLSEQEVTLIEAGGPWGWASAAKKSGRFIYELLSGISPKIKRKVI